MPMAQIMSLLSKQALKPFSLPQCTTRTPQKTKPTKKTKQKNPNPQPTNQPQQGVAAVDRIEDEYKQI